MYNNQQLKGSMTLAANTYAEEQILMPQMPEGLLPGFLRVEVQVDQADVMDATGDNLAFHISPKQQSAVLKIGDEDCICGDSRISTLAAATVAEAHTKFVYEFPAPQLISYRSIWIGAQATNAGELDYVIHWIPRQSRVPQRDNLVSQAQF